LKLSKRELKEQRELYNQLLTGTTFSSDFIDKVYEELNPAICGDNISENGTYWTPDGLAGDLSLFCNIGGHIVDICAGIGMLSYRLKCRDYHEKKIKSITAIEVNPHFVELGKKLLPDVNWICADVFDKNLWDKLVKDLPDKRFNLAVSNPPFGVDTNKKDYSWLNYHGHRDLMAVELALKYSKHAYYILPSSSVPFRYSGAPWHEDNPERYSQKLKKFIKENKEYKFSMVCDGIDTTIYKDQWKNLPGGIGC
jgi:predicted RNA methylase